MNMDMNGRERLTRIYQGRLPDRPAVRLWGAVPNLRLLHSAYKPAYDLAMATTDLVYHGVSPFDPHWGSAKEDICEVTHTPTGQDEWVDRVTTVHTPAGTLRSVYAESTVDKPGYQKERLLKEPDDIHKVLSVPYHPYPFDADPYLSAERTLGERGITLYGLYHAMYAVHGLIGSENFAYWSVDHRDLILEAISIYSRRVTDEVNRVFDAGLTPAFGWVGPELCIPPLASPRDFDKFVYPFDKSLVDLIHERGGTVWVHCHGDMNPVLERFINMGVDVLNPVEPPPIGSLTLAEAFDRVGDRMALEGNIETHDLITASKDRIVELVREAIDAADGHRLILCQCSGFMEWPEPPGNLAENLLTFLEEGVRYAKEHSYA